MSEKIDLRGKSRDEIDHLTKGWRRDRFLDAIHELATIEPHYSPRTVAKAREMRPLTIAKLCANGTIPDCHKPLQNGWRIPDSSLRKWDKATRVARTVGNGHDNGD